MNDNFLVVQVGSTANTTDGDYLYRIRQPAEAMGKLPGVMVVNLRYISPYLKEICLSADVLVLHLIREPDMLPIVAERKRRGLATVYEISDNFMALPPSVQKKLSFIEPISLATTFQLIRLADAIQGVSEILLEKCSFLHERRVVFENQVMEMGSVQERSGEGIVIGWAGSLGHTEDIKSIAPVVKNVCEKYPHVRFAFMGNRVQYEKVFGRVASSQFSYTEAGGLSDYYDFLEGLDIGLAPLMNTPFNTCRSDVKFLEYASRGVLPVVSDVDPYKKHATHGVNAFLFKNSESLRNILETLIMDKTLRQSVKERAYNYVKNERREDAHATERIAFYEGIGRGRSSGALPLDLLEQYSPESQAYQVKQTLAERKMIQGVYLESKGRLKEAREVWMEASRDLPEYYFPQFCVANSLMEEDTATAVEHFRLALSINPESLRTGLLLGRVLKKKDREAAHKEFEKTLQVFSDFAPAWKEIGLLKKEQGRFEDAAILLNKALEVNPFYAAAASELGKIYLVQEKRELAAEAFRVAANLIPDRVDYQVDVIKALVELGNMDEAVQDCMSYLNQYPRCGEIYSLLSRILEAKGKQKEDTWQNLF